MSTYLVEEPYYSKVELSQNKLFGSKENLLGAGIQKLLNVFSLPKLTEDKIIVEILLLDAQYTLRPSNMTIDINYITDIKFNPKRMALEIKYSFPKIETGWFGRGQNKGSLVFQTVKFAEWQNHLTRIIMERKKDKMGPEMTKVQEELDDVTAKIESARKQLLEGKIDQQNFNLCTKDWMKKQKDLDKQLRKMQKDLESMR